MTNVLQKLSLIFNSENCFLIIIIIIIKYNNNYTIIIFCIN